MHYIQYFHIQIGSAANYVYDGIILYALTVQQMTNDGVDYRDGANFLRYSQRVLFKGSQVVFNLYRTKLKYLNIVIARH